MPRDAGWSGLTTAWTRATTGAKDGGAAWTEWRALARSANEPSGAPSGRRLDVRLGCLDGSGDRRLLINP
eukprot:4731502-Alexandrium_andersonii.AAC.1